jgi:hypothetical protein
LIFQRADVRCIHMLRTLGYGETMCQYFGVWEDR